MQIDEIQLVNFRGIANASFSLSPQLNVLAGVNGSGKTTILEAAAISLSWLVNRIQRENTSGKPILESNIKNDTDTASIASTFREARKTYSCKIIRTRKGTRSSERSDLGGVTELASLFQGQLGSKGNLPVIAYYPINRVVNNTSPEIPRKETLDVIDVYENALGGKANYQAFFDWFRLQDDILNERANSRTKWMAANKRWVRTKANKLIDSLDRLTSRIDGEDEEYISQIKRRFRNEKLIYDEPRYFFIELSEALNFISHARRNEKALYDIYHDLEYMLHRMASLSDSRRDNLIELNDYPFRIIGQISNRISDRLKKRPTRDNIQLYKFIWDALIFSVLLSLWWTSDKAKKAIENNFKKLGFSEIKLREWSPEAIDKMLASLKKVVSDDIDRHKNVTRNEGRELRYVTQAVEHFIPEYSNLRASRIPRPQMLVEKDGQSLNLDQLSDGEKNLIALVGDIARRLSMANGNSRNPLAGEGIILIDEIDLHLHPSWQRLMIPKLLKLFPKCQFIISTHSPQVLSHAQPESIFLLKMVHGDFSFSKATESFGKNTDRILEDLLGVDARPTEEKQRIHDLYTLIEKGELEAAKKEISAIRALIKDDPELVRAESLLKRKEIIGK